MDPRSLASSYLYLVILSKLDPSHGLELAGYDDHQELICRNILPLMGEHPLYRMIFGKKTSLHPSRIIDQMNNRAPIGPVCYTNPNIVGVVGPSANPCYWCRFKYG